MYACALFSNTHVAAQCIVRANYKFPIIYTGRPEIRSNGNFFGAAGGDLGIISSVDLPTLVDPDFSSVLIHFSASSFAGMLAYRLDIMCSPLSLQNRLSKKAHIRVIY